MLKAHYKDATRLLGHWQSSGVAALIYISKPFSHSEHADMAEMKALVSLAFALIYDDPNPVS